MYEVYVGNLSILISHQNLRDLFYSAGEIVSTWICSVNHKKFTYAFIKFHHLKNAKKACEIYNNANIDGLIIKVHLSNKLKKWQVISDGNLTVSNF